MEDKKKNRRGKGVLIGWILGGLFLVLALTVRWVGEEYDATFSISFTSLLYTVAFFNQGADTGFIWDMARVILPKVALAVVGVSLAGVLVLGPGRRIWRGRVTKLLTLVLAVAAVALLGWNLRYLDQVVGLSEYLEHTKRQTTIYEDYYVDPAQTQITAPEEKKNLLLIYLESMETQYADVAAGGSQPVNYIPGLTQLAQENLSFSNTEALGGFVTLPRTNWTMGSLFASHTGIPFAFPVDGNTMGDQEIFAAQTTGLGELLAENGYRQMFLCGSDSIFAGRSHFFQQHGDYEIYDYYDAKSDGYFPEDHYVWWGMEDLYLYQAAQDRLLELAAGSEPFNLTMLTVDTHHVSGYVCPQCGDEYDQQLPNVLTCADRQLMAFLEWVQAQDFYDDMVVVIIGDHPRMDQDLIGELDLYERTIYNCILNTDTVPRGATTGRQYCTMDLFPTLVEALGFQIQGDRLGLGTSLFSVRPTRLEELGLEFWDRELRKESLYYTQRFS